MLRLIIRFLFVMSGFCSILFVSCSEDEECRQTRYVRMYAGFYTINTDTITNIESEARLKLTDSLSVRGIGAESFLYTNAVRKDSVNLPLNKSANLSEFVFTFKDSLSVAVSDTVGIYYENHERYLSFECGCLNTFTLDSLKIKTTHHYIDSVVVKFKEVNTTHVENIKIYHTR